MWNVTSYKQPDKFVLSKSSGCMQVLWPDGIFVTKHPRNSPPSDSSALEDNRMEFPDESKAGQQRPPVNLTEQKPEAARRAAVVREIILGTCCVL